MKHFIFFDENKQITHCLEVLGPSHLLKEMEENVDDIFWDKIREEIDMRDLETKYGVHDVSYRASTELLGFSSYEVTKWKTLMKIWREILTSFGLEVGKYYTKKRGKRE
jgi:hypothetical protein